MTASERIGTRESILSGETFDDFERRRWGETAGAYERSYLELTDQTIERLLDRGLVGAGSRCLDMACGPGTLAAAAAARGATVVGIDVAPEMVERARARFPAIEFRVGDAERLDLPPASLDAVLMNFGLMHLARPEAALGGIAAALVPGGRFCFTVWAPPERSAAARLIAEAMALAEVAVAMPAGEPFYRFCDRDASRRALESAGFEPSSVGLEEIALSWRMADPGALFELFATATTRSSLVIAAQPEPVRRAIREAFARKSESHRTSNGEIVVPHSAILVSARRAAGS